MYGIREDTVSKAIKKLEKYGYIKCKYNWKSDTKSKRLVYLTIDIWNKCNECSSLYSQDDLDYLTKHNINSNNKNNYNNNLSIISKKNSYDEYPINDGLYDKELEEMENLLAPFRYEDE